MTKNKAKKKAIEYFVNKCNWGFMLPIDDKKKGILRKDIEKAIDIAISETKKEYEDGLTNKDIQWSRKLNEQIHELKKENERMRKLWKFKDNQKLMGIKEKS